MGVLLLSVAELKYVILLGVTKWHDKMCVSYDRYGIDIGMYIGCISTNKCILLAACLQSYGIFLRKARIYFYFGYFFYLVFIIILYHLPEGKMDIVKRDEFGLPDDIQTRLEAIKARSQYHRKEPTPKEAVKARVGRGGKTFDYVDRWYCHQWLDKYYPGWSFECLGDFKVDYQCVSVRGTLTVFEPEGLKRTFTLIGDMDLQWSDEKDPITGKPTGKKLLVEDAPYYKGAEADALKKCATCLGFASDIYSRTTFIDDEPINDVYLIEFFDEVYPKIKDQINTVQLANITRKFLNKELDLQTIKHKMRLE